MKLRALILSLLLLCTAASELFAASIVLPASRRLAGALNSADSTFGDEFFNFPQVFNGRAQPGKTHLSGWIEFRFDEPVGKTARFTIRFDGVGSDDGILFPGGQTYELLKNHAFHNPGLVSSATLNLETGEITDLALHAVFRNSVISRVTRNIRIPFGFLNDYPPLDLPVALPFSDRPRVFQEGRFTTDSGGRITGFEFRGETIAPVTLFPQLGLFPVYAFGDQGRFYFANPIGCVAGTPPQNCPLASVAPDGILLASNAFFHPHFELITSELAETPASLPTLPSLPAPAAGGAGLVPLSGRYYQVGGFNGAEATDVIQVFDPAANRWSASLRLPEAVRGATAAASGSRLVVAGGWDDRGRQPQRQVQVFDERAGRWTPGLPLPVGVAGAVAAASAGRIYVIGGWSSGASGSVAPTDAVQVYDPDANSWSSGPALPVALAGQAAAVVGADIYCINGLTAGGATTNRVFILNTTTLRWREGPTTLRGVYEAAAAAVGQRVYLAGGRLASGGPVDTARMQILEIPRSLWRDGHALPLAVTGAGAAVWNGKVLVSGGWLSSSTERPTGPPTRALQTYDPALGWSVSGGPPLFAATDVMNAAAGVVAAPFLSPGCRGIILGSNLAPASSTSPGARFDGTRYTSDLPLSLNGVSVRIDNIACPIVSVAPDRVEFQVPFRIRVPVPNVVNARLELRREDAEPSSHSVEIMLGGASPGVYMYDYGERRDTLYLDGATAAARNSDGRLNHPSNPARPGEEVILRVTGIGPIDPLPEDGRRTYGAGAARAILPMTVAISGRPARVVEASLLPGEAGICELRVAVPQDSSRGNNIPVEVTAGGIRANRTVISVR